MHNWVNPSSISTNPLHKQEDGRNREQSGWRRERKRNILKQNTENERMVRAGSRKSSINTKYRDEENEMDRNWERERMEGEIH